MASKKIALAADKRTATPGSVRPRTKSPTASRATSTTKLSDEPALLHLIFDEEEEAYLRPADVAEFFSLFDALYDTPGFPLQIQRLSYASPLEIWFYGISGALVAATVLAGGEIDILRGKAKLGMSLGRAIGELRQALSGRTEPQRKTKKKSAAGSLRPATKNPPASPRKGRSAK